MSETVNIHETTKERYIKYLTQCLFSHKDYFTEDRILDFEEFEKKSLQNTSDNIELS